jgi:hypothetical protein
MRLRHLLLAGIVLAIFGLVGHPGTAAAQLPDPLVPGETLWEIRLVDGSTIIGRVEAVAAERISVRTPGGVTAEVDLHLIQRMTAVRGMLRDGQFWRDDPNRTRLFFGPTGRMLARGEGYVSVFELFFPFVAGGVSDHLTLAGGTILFPELIGRIWYAAPKVGGNLSERTALSAGVIAFVNLDSDPDDDIRSAGILYVVGTQGGEDHAATLGVGWGFAGTEVQNQPFFMIGGESRLSPRLKLLSENYLITYRESGPNEERRVAGMASAGIRFIGDRLSADAGFGFLAGDGDTFCCLPLVNFVYNFGGSR